MKNCSFCKASSNFCYICTFISFWSVYYIPYVNTTIVFNAWSNQIHQQKGIFIWFWHNTKSLFGIVSEPVKPVCNQVGNQNLKLVGIHKLFFGVSSESTGYLLKIAIFVLCPSVLLTDLWVLLLGMLIREAKRCSFRKAFRVKKTKLLTSCGSPISFFVIIIIF